MDPLNKDKKIEPAAKKDNDINANEITELKNKLAECEKIRDEFKDGWQRERASFENFQKNLETLFKEREIAIEKKMLADVFEVIDAFSMALKAIPEDKKNDSFINGIYQIKARLNDFLNKNDVIEFGKEGDEFNPSLHEAIAVEKVSKKDQDGKIIKVAGLGFKLNGAVIRPAKVVIGQF